MRSLLLCAFVASATGMAEELNSKNFEKKVYGGKKAAFVKFLAPW